MTPCTPEQVVAIHASLGQSCWHPERVLQEALDTIAAFKADMTPQELIRMQLQDELRIGRLDGTERAERMLDDA